MKRALYLLAATAVAALSLADAAEAKDKGKGKGKVKWKGGHVEYSVKSRPGRNRGHATAPGHIYDCPPGLAKKNPPCVPPGLARSGGRDHDHYHDDDRYYDDDRVVVYPGDIDEVYSEYELREVTYVTTLDGDVIRVGDRLVRPIDRYPRLDAGRFGLPPLPDDEVYVRVGDAAVRLDSGTQRVVTILTLADLLLD